MSAPAARALRSLAWVVPGCLLAFCCACSVPSVDYTGKRCPCLAPWVCGADDLCRLPASDGDADSDADLDADLPRDGDTEPDADSPRDADGDVPAGAVRRVVCGLEHSCALLGSGALRCWGRGELGALGYGNTDAVGDDETPATAGDVPVGGAVRQVAVGAHHSCALLETGAVRCWGAGDAGQLGYGNTDDVGDDETPDAAGDVDLGVPAVQIVAGDLHSCALLEGGGVRCWGAGEGGRLGYRSHENVGDDETPASAGDIELGGPARIIAAGSAHTCALLESDAVRCWGVGADGRLGYGNERNVGDNETPAAAGDVELGGTVVGITAGSSHSCALFDTGSIRCWGAAGQGQLGYGNTNAIGDNETPVEAGYVNVGGLVTQVSAGGDFTCALLDTGEVRCWGAAAAIGLGYAENVGDDEPPASSPAVPLI